MLGKLLLLAGATYAGYKLFPEKCFEFAKRTQRRLSGLTLKETMIDDHRIPYLEGGIGEPLLLLHGFGAEKDHWSQIAKFLTPHFRVIAPDIPGFGDASRLSEARYDLDSQLERIGKFASSLGLHKFHLGGNSMGGYLSAMYAAKAPEQVQSLWLLAPAGSRDAELSELFNLIARGDNVLMMETDVSGKRLANMVFAKTPWVPAEFNRIWRERGMQNRAFNQKMFDEIFGDPIFLEDRIAGLTTPTLIVWGDDDRLVHRSGATTLKKMLPQADVRIMPYMGHCPMVERPRDTAADYLSFHRKAVD